MAEYIEREAAIKAADEIDTWVAGWRDEHIKRLKAIPVADVRPVRKGEWMEILDDNNDPYYVCSACKAEFVCVEGTPDENMYYFCPNCGADMRQQEKEET